MNRNSLLDRRLPFALLSILSLFPLLALAVPTKRNVAQPVIDKRNGSQTCGFTGDDNTYGLGIRLGVYFQWITSSLAYNFVPEEAATMRGVNNCFQASVFAGLLFVTKTRGSDLYAVEAFIMLTFCMGGVCSGDTPTEGGERSKPKRYAYHGASSIGWILRGLLAIGFCAYGVWFTFKGMDNMQHPPCSTYAFFLAKVNLYNWFRTFLKASFTIGAVSYAIGILVALGFGVFEFFTCLGRSPKDPNDLPSDDEKDTQQAEVQQAAGLGHAVTTTVGAVGPSGALLMFITAVELMVRWNHIQGVNSLGSTGQLLPLIIGAGGLGRVVWRILVGIFN